MWPYWGRVYNTSAIYNTFPSLSVTHTIWTHIYFALTQLSRSMGGAVTHVNDPMTSYTMTVIQKHASTDFEGYYQETGSSHIGHVLMRFFLHPSLQLDALAEMLKFSSIDPGWMDTVLMWVNESKGMPRVYREHTHEVGGWVWEELLE